MGSPPDHEAKAGKPPGRTYRAVAVKGFGWLAGLQVASAAFSQVSSILLAILLSPLDFGVFGTAMIAITLVAIPGDLGLTIELIQRRNLEEGLGTALKVRWVIAACLTAAAFVAAFGLSNYSGQPYVLLVVAAMAAIFPAAAIGFGPRVLLSRDLNFRSIALADLAGRLSSPVVTLILALSGWGYWALATGFVVSQWVSPVLLFMRRPVTFRGRFSSSVARRLLSFGKYVSLTSLLAYLLATMDNGVALFSFGVVSLGYYALAYSFAVTIPRSIASTVDTVVFPIYSKISHDKPRTAQGFIATLRYVAYFAFPVGAAFVVLSNGFVTVILGSKWQDASFPMEILGIAGLAYSLSVPASALLYGMGKPKSVASATAAGVGVMGFGLIAAIIAESFWAIAVAAAIGALAYLLCLGYAVSRSLGLRAHDFLGVLMPAAAAATLAGALGLVLTVLTPLSLISLVAALGAGFAAYLLIIELLSRGEFSKAVRELTRLLRQ